MGAVKVPFNQWRPVGQWAASGWWSASQRLSGGLLGCQPASAPGRSQNHLRFCETRRTGGGIPQPWCRYHQPWWRYLALTFLHLHAHPVFQYLKEREFVYSDDISQLTSDVKRPAAMFIVTNGNRVHPTTTLRNRNDGARVSIHLQITLLKHKRKTWLHF